MGSFLAPPDHRRWAGRLVPAAGMAQLPYRTFHAGNLAGGVAWATAIVLDVVVIGCWFATSSASHRHLSDADADATEIR